MSARSPTHALPELGRGARARSSSGDWRARCVLLGLTAVFVVAALWDAGDELGVTLCPFRALTHHPCPGCGMTRAFCALMHGELWRAVRLNPFSPLLFLAALAAWARAAAAVFRVERLRSILDRLPRPTPFATWAMLALVMAWWAARLAWGL
ncbi:MAG TPA: DUF2752 domain-containing protein [Pyrinomonadaceae bacterium]|nr:DUF2752 domain-containing protein [Pyrinomonadaceae bacterium]